jgi:hypothetical protein
VTTNSLALSSPFDPGLSRFIFCPLIELQNTRDCTTRIKYLVYAHVLWWSHEIHRLGIFYVIHHSFQRIAKFVLKKRGWWRGKRQTNKFPPSHYVSDNFVQFLCFIWKSFSNNLFRNVFDVCGHICRSDLLTCYSKLYIILFRTRWVQIRKVSTP